MKKRIFVGVPFDDEARRGVEKILKILERKHWPVRWKRVEKLHITVAFLGWVGERDEILRRRDAHSVSAAQDDTADLKSVSAVSSAVERGVVGIRPFELRFKGLGGFPQQPSARVSADGLFSRFGNRGKVRGRPDLEMPRVVWLGLKGDLKSMARLYKEVRIQLENLGFKLEARPFVPHVTLGRVRREARLRMKKEIGRQLDKLRELDVVHKLQVDRVVVYESQMRREGSVYKEITKVRLG